MNYIISITLFIITNLVSHSLISANYIATAKKVFMPELSSGNATIKPEKFDQMTLIARQLESLEQMRTKVTDQITHYENELEKIAGEILQIKSHLKKHADNQGFLQKKKMLLERTYQTVFEIIQELRQTISMLELYGTELQNYHEDPEFKEFLLPKKSSFDFDDLKKSAQTLFSAKSRLDELENLKKTIEHDHEKRKKALDVLIKEYEVQEQQQKDFSPHDTLNTETASFTQKELGEIFDEQLRFLNYKKQFAQLKVDEDIVRLELIDSRLLIRQRQVEVLEQQYAYIKRSVAIDPAYMKSAEEILEKHRQEFFDKRERLNEQISLLLPLREQFKKNFEHIMQRFEVSAHDVNGIKEWEKIPENLKTINDWLAVTVLGSIHAHEMLIETQIESLNTEIRQANINLRHEELEMEILRSWYHMTYRKARFNADEEIENEIKKYRTEQGQLKIDLAELVEKRDTIINMLYRLNIIQDKIKTFISALGRQQFILFNHNQKEYHEAQEGLIRTDDEVRKRIVFIGKIMETYAKSITRIKDDIKEIDDIMAELGAKGFWVRSEHSIEWKDLENFIPDVKRFLRDLKNIGVTSVKNFSTQNIIQKISDYSKQPYILILLFLRILIACLVFIFIWIYLPDLTYYISQKESRYRMVARVRALLVVFLEFTQVHLIGMYAWSVMYFIVHSDWVDHYIAVWFYLLSIPYLIFLFYQFFSFFLQVNKSKEYLFISQNYIWRFTSIVSVLVYATIGISFFRQAFMVGHYYDSQMPDILLAINIVLLQIALIFLIGKEQILSIFAYRDTPAIQWIEERIEKYYYIVLFFVMAIIVMSNPYVGYGRQVFYVVSRVIITACLIPLFSWMHNRIKRSSSDFFFYYTDGSAVKERFPGGKTWYGVFIVIWFFVFLLLGIVFGARIWGTYITSLDIKHWLSYTIYSPGLDEVTGKPILVTGMSVIKIVMYIFGGFGVAYIINRFMLQRIFDPLLIGSGVQSTILTITRYIAVILALLLGLQSAGLEGMAMKLVVLVGIMSFAVKEPLADFFAYFIILVQRPIKIGDFIQVTSESGSETNGIVRHITPRSTIVRHKNSITLIIPNSTIITNTVRNWSYVRTFTALNDIFITLPFTVDADKARQIILETVQGNATILKNPMPIVWLNDFTEQGYRFLVRCFISVEKVTERFEIESNVRLELVRRLRQEGMPLAIPVRLVKNVQEAAYPIISEQQ